MQSDGTISEESEVSNLFSNFSKNVANLLDIKKEQQCNEIYPLSNTVEITITKFEQHPIIKIIKENVCNTTTLGFMPAEIDDIIKEISNPDSKKEKVLLNICLHAE